MESGQSKVGRNVVFIHLYLYYFTSILEETFVIVKYLLRANACWVFWVYKYHRINTYFALESVVFLLVVLPVWFTSLILLCDVLACRTSFMLFCPPLFPGRSRSGGPCCVLCLHSHF